MQFLLAIGKIPARPAIYADLIARLADFKRLLLGLHSLGLVNIIDAIRKPYTAVSCICFDCVNSFTRCLALYALGSDLPAGLVPNNLAIFERHAVVVSELTDRTNVNHVISLSGFVGFPSLTVITV